MYIRTLILSEKCYYVIFRLFKHFDKNNKILMTWIYCTYIKPIIMYGAAVYWPFMIKDIDQIEDMQRYFTTYVGDNIWPYSERIKILGLDNLEHAFIISVLKTSFNIIRGLFKLGAVSIKPAQCINVVLAEYIFHL